MNSSTLNNAANETYARIITAHCKINVKIGIKSTAILFGRFDKLIIGLFQLATVLLLCLIGYLNQLGGAFYWSLLLVGALFVYQQQLIANRERDKCFQAFMNNNYVGLVIFLGLLMSLVLE